MKPSHIEYTILGGNDILLWNRRAPSANDPTKEERHLISDLAFVTGGGLCSGPPNRVEISGLAAAAARLAGLTSAQLGHIWKCFHKIDVDNSKQISFEEFADFCDAIASDFIKEVARRMVFSITDLDGDGQLNFEEFVLATVLLSTFSTDQIMFIMFEIFDGNGNHFIDKKEFMGLSKAVEELAGSLFPGNYSAFCDVFDKNSDGLIDFDEFMVINHQFPMIFFPALRMQVRRVQYAAWGKSAVTGLFC